MAWRGILSGCLVCSLCACAKLPADWIRADGVAIAPPQLQADELACHGELTKATLAAGRNAPYGSDAFGYQGASIDIYRGCMAQHGYLPVQNR